MILRGVIILKDYQNRSGTRGLHELFVNLRPLNLHTHPLDSDLDSVHTSPVGEGKVVWWGTGRVREDDNRKEKQELGTCKFTGRDHT